MPATTKSEATADVRQLERGVLSNNSSEQHRHTGVGSRTCQAISQEIRIWSSQEIRIGATVDANTTNRCTRNCGKL